MDVDIGLDGYADVVEIGRGSYGVVYQARQLSFDRVVAIKVLAPGGMTDDSRRRFEREGRAMAALSWHPNIVTIHDAGTTRFGQPYLVLEHAPGGSFAAGLKRNGPLSPAEVRDVGIAIAGALLAAHDAGVLHRDVKPENILLMTSGAPALTDFGIAAVQDSTATATGMLTATVAHAAPEVLLGGRASVASDVYSLGSTLHALMAGRAAFVRATDESLVPIVMRAIQESPPDLRATGCPNDLADIIERAMARDPDQRPTTAAALGSALAAVQLDDRARGTIAAEPEPPPEVDSPAEPTVVRARRTPEPPSAQLDDALVKTVRRSRLPTSRDTDPPTAASREGDTTETADATTEPDRAGTDATTRRAEVDKPSHRRRNVAIAVLAGLVSTGAAVVALALFNGFSDNEVSSAQRNRAKATPSTARSTTPTATPAAVPPKVILSQGASNPCPFDTTQTCSSLHVHYEGLTNGQHTAECRWVYAAAIPLHTTTFYGKSGDFEMCGTQTASIRNQYVTIDGVDWKWT